MNKNYYINTDANLCGIADGNTGSIIYVKGKNNITISSSTVQTRFRAGCINSEVTGNTNVTLYNGLNKDYSTEITINCEGYNYLVINATDLSSVQVEEGTTSTDYIEHEQTDYILYIQQEMLKGDYFVKESDGWKEVHGFEKYIFTGNENISYSSANKVFYTDMFTNKQAGINNFIVNAFKVINTDSYANMTNYSCAGNSTNSRIVFKYTELISIEEFKQFLKERYNAGNSVYVFYKATTPTKLVCTEEQSAVLEELNNLELFESVNNIITAEDIALLKLKYALNAKIYIDNLLAKQSENTVAEEV